MNIITTFPLEAFGKYSNPERLYNGKRKKKVQKFD